VDSTDLACVPKVGFYADGDEYFSSCIGPGNFLNV